MFENILWFGNPRLYKKNKKVKENDKQLTEQKEILFDTLEAFKKSWLG